MNTTIRAIGGQQRLHAKLWLTFMTLFGLALIAMSFAAANSAYAQNKLCIPPAVGVPWLPGPPQWWDGKDQNGNEIPSYDFTDPQWDPRWLGARAAGYGSGGAVDATFRALSANENGTTYLYLSWYVSFAPSFSPEQTSLYVGFSPTQPSPNAPPFVIRATFNNVTNDATDVAGPGVDLLTPPPPNTQEWGVTPWTLTKQNDGTWTNQNVNITNLTWWPSGTTQNLNQLSTARGWNSNIVVNQVSYYSWAVNLRIPIQSNDPTGANGVYIPDPGHFKFWYYIQPNGVVTQNSINFIPYTWPSSQGQMIANYIVDEPGLSFCSPIQP